MEKTWIIKPSVNNEIIKSLAEELNIDPVLAILLEQRGITNFQQAKEFFRPSLEKLHDPFLMQDMEKAVFRLKEAIANNEKILIYGDYDVDGTTSVAMVYSFIDKRYSNIGYYVPDRYSEGYGISYKGIDFASSNGFSLVIALDCGIKAVEKIDYANQKGIDFIICDHHLPGDIIPSAVAVLDPKRPNCQYPFKELSGCGVGFKFLQAYAIKENIPFDEVFSYIDMVVVSIASDIVPITGENRILAYFGLQRLNASASIGLQAIKKTAGLVETEININDIVFKIGPRINAAGRIENGLKAVELMICEKEETAYDLALAINTCNDHRKNLDQGIFSEAVQFIENTPEQRSRKTTVLFNPNWHKGVIGIVASRLIDYYYRPTIIMTQSNGVINGSARTVEGFDLYKAIDSCSDLLENYGGHMFAAGLTLRPENLDAFTERFENYVASTITKEEQTPRIEIDAEIDLEKIDGKFFRILQQFQPFGPGNMTPVFLSRGVSDTGYGRTVGKNNEHLKLELKQKNCGYIFPSIGFQLGYKVEEAVASRNFDVCFSIDKNEFMGKTNLQLRIRDIKNHNF